MKKYYRQSKISILVHDYQIERWWRELHQRMEKYFKRQLHRLLDEGVYDPNEQTDRSVYVYISTSFWENRHESCRKINNVDFLVCLITVNPAIQVRSSLTCNVSVRLKLVYQVSNISERDLWCIYGGFAWKIGMLGPYQIFFIEIN